MQEDFIFNEIYFNMLKYFFSKLKCSVCLNCDDINTSTNKFHSTRLQFALQFLKFFYSLYYQHILRNKRLTFWENSISLNFTSCTRNDEKSDFGPRKMGGGRLIHK